MFKLKTQKLHATCYMLHKKKGFTIVELLIYMTLLSGFLLLMTRIFSSTLDVQLESESQSAIQQDSRYILSRLTYDIQRATSVTTPATQGGSGATLAMVIGGVTNTYALSGTNLTLTNSNPADQLNSINTQVSGLLFKRIGNVGGKDTVQVQFTLTSSTKRIQGADVKSFQTTVGLR
jgi:type II secretory pathway component PulJ